MEGLLSQVWSVLGLVTVLQNILPTQLLSLLHSIYDSLLDIFSPFSYFDVPEFNGYCGVDVNDLYRHVHLYLNSVNSSTSSACRRLTLSRSKSSNRISFSVAPNHTIHDSFCGHSLSWTHHVDTLQDSLDERRSFTLKLPKLHRRTLLDSYLQHVMSRAEELERVSRERRLFTNTGNASYDSGWVSVPFRHPSTFGTLALEPQLKKQIMDDLKAFADGREFYRSVGRAWKRGYLLYGPPGSGKSSLIAAMANYLCYDVYDLELTKVTDNSELRALLIQTTNRSIIVIEDIDCSLELTADRMMKTSTRTSTASMRKKSRHHQSRKDRPIGSDDQHHHHHHHAEERGSAVTLSGLLNFTDGLWSCCGEERIIVFTTNHRENVDPALVRCGRMDMHLRLGTCGMHAFRVLAMNYLGIESHFMFEEVERCIRSGVALTPAQIGEILLRNRGNNVDVAMKEVVSAMQVKMLSTGRAIGGGTHHHHHQQVASVDDQHGETIDTMMSRSPQSVLMAGWQENWESLSASPPAGAGAGAGGGGGGNDDNKMRMSEGKKRKDDHHIHEGQTGGKGGNMNWEKKAKLLVRLRSLTKSDSGTGRS